MILSQILVPCGLASKKLSLIFSSVLCNFCSGGMENVVWRKPSKMKMFRDGDGREGSHGLRPKTN